MYKEESTRQAKRIREGDTVKVLSGNDRGKTGKVLSRTDETVLVQGLNIRKKHVKPTQLNPKGGIVEVERPIHASKVQVVTDGGKPVKLKVRVNANGGRELYYTENNQQVLYRTVKKTK